MQNISKPSPKLLDENCKKFPKLPVPAINLLTILFETDRKSYFEIYTFFLPLFKNCFKVELSCNFCLHLTWTEQN